MSDQDLFNSNSTPPAPSGESATPSNDLSTMLANIKDADGRVKYASIDKALEALNHSQMFIPQLKSELESERQKRLELEARLKSQADLEAALDKLVAKRSEGLESPPNIPSGIDEQKVQDIVRNYFEGTKAAERAEQNKNLVISKLTEKFGDKAQEQIKAKAAELGITTEAMGKLAIESPQVVLTLFSTGSTPQSSTPPSPLNLHGNPKEDKLPERVTGMLAGVSDRQKGELMRRIREETYKELGITQ